MDKKLHPVSSGRLCDLQNLWRDTPYGAQINLAHGWIGRIKFALGQLTVHHLGATLTVR